MAKQIATIGSLHTCPMITGLIPHAGGTVSGPGIPGVLIDNLPVSVLGDMCICTGPPDTVVTGCPGVLVDGKPVVTVGSMTAHGGMVTAGVPGVVISSASMKPAAVPLKDVPFPEISLVSRIFQSKQAKEAKDKQKEVKDCIIREDDKDKRIFNLQWRYEDMVISEREVDKKVFLTADTWGYGDGEEVKFSIYLHDRQDKQAEKKIEEVSGKVCDGKVKIEWTVDKQKIKEVQDA